MVDMDVGFFKLIFYGAVPSYLGFSRAFFFKNNLLRYWNFPKIFFWTFRIVKLEGTKLGDFWIQYYRSSKFKDATPCWLAEWVLLWSWFSWTHSFVPQKKSKKTLPIATRWNKHPSTSLQRETCPFFTNRNTDRIHNTLWKMYEHVINFIVKHIIAFSRSPSNQIHARTIKSVVHMKLHCKGQRPCGVLSDISINHFK